MNIKYSIILPIYKDRKSQFRMALKAYAEQTFPKDRFELIVIDQGNDENIAEMFSSYGLIIKHIKVDLNLAGYNGGQNPSYAQNVGIKEAKGEYIILTSPEVCFERLALEKIDSKMIPTIMIYCSVGETEYLDPKVLFDYEYLKGKRTGMWLCHSVRRRLPMAYFMAVVPKQSIFDIGGVDEDFMQAIGYEDDDFGRRIKTKVQPLYDDTIIGAHLSHSRSYQQGSGSAKVQVGSNLFSAKERNPNGYPIVANTNRQCWGSPKGITSISLYDRGKLITETEKVTVFTSCYNQAAHLEKAIISVLNQSYTNFEYLIYDDGSTDNTWEIIQKYAFQDRRITAFKLEKQPNVGVVINKSISDSSGSFWTWCPSDDIWMPNLLQEKLNASRKYNHEAVLYSDWYHIDENDNPLGEVKVIDLTKEQFWEVVWKDSPIGFTGIWIPIQIFKKCGKFPEHLQYSEDFYWMVKACCHRIPFLKCAGLLYKKRLHNNRLSARNANDLTNNANNIREELKRYQIELWR